MRRRFLGIIDKESDRLTRLISDLLDLAKIESGAVNWRIADTDLRRVVDQAAVSLASLAEEKAIQLRVLECAPMPVKVDADRIQQVVTNLIGNALKFSERSGRVEVQLRGATTSGPRNSLEGDYAVVSIADSGPGIPPEDQERVFERFYRGAKHRPSSPGTGLGLTISREIVLHHQGEIWMESQPGAGSTFYFSLPMRSEIPASTRAHSEGKA
jgi:signal transduction histidine kinase